MVAIAGLSMVIAGTWGAVQWSLIPTAIDGRIASVGHQSETGLRWRTITLADGRTWVVDRKVVADLGDDRRLRGHQVRKDRFERSVHIGSKSTPLDVSNVSWSVIGVLSIFAFVAVRRTRTAPLGPSRPQRLGGSSDSQS